MEHSREDFKNVMKIHTPKEFSFTENLNYLQRSPNECLFTIVDLSSDQSRFGNHVSED